MQKCEEEEEGREEWVIDPADPNWIASGGGGGGGGKKGRNYCGAWEDDRATFATVCIEVYKEVQLLGSLFVEW